jgi:glycosyltransferase involved in cell wall biosynthesis
VDANFEYEISVGTVREVPTFTWVNQVAARFQWRRFLERHLDPSADVLMTQGLLGPASVQVANERDVPSMLFVRSLLLLGRAKYWPELGTVSNFKRTDLGGRVQFPFLLWNFEQYRSAIESADVVIANSEFVAEEIAQLADVDSVVVNPPIRLEDYNVEHDPDGYVTMVNPRAAYKGADVFLDVAAAMPDEEFLLAGPISESSISERVRTLPNVTHLEWCDDMREVYRQSKAVVVPSRCQESFGRVAAEAMVSGIPCVVSDCGALPEVVGDTGIVVSDGESVAAWTSAIREAIDSNDPDAQRARVTEHFSVDRQVERLDSAIQRVLDR